MLLDEAFRQRAQRGTTIGADAIIDRVAAELAESPRVARQPVRQSSQRGPRLRPALVFMAAFLLVVGAVGVAVVLAGRSSPEPAVTTTQLVTTTQVVTTTTPESTTTTIGDTTTTSTTSTTTLPPIPDQLAITWTEVPSQPAFGADALAGDVVASVIATDRGVLAVGGRYTDADVNLPAAWTSPDGTIWTAGSGFEDSPGLMLDDVAAGPGGFVAVSFQDSFDFDERPPVWYSPDGGSWMRLTDGGEAFSGLAKITSIVADDAGYVAAGTFRVDAENGSQLGDAAVWTSPDGLTWTRLDLGIGGAYETSVIRDVAIGPDGIVAVGHGGEGDWFYGASPRPLGRQFLLTSPDGVAWERTELTAEPGWPSSVTVVDGTTIAVGYAGNHLAAWVAGPGSATMTEYQIAGGLNSFAAGVVIDGDRWLVVGYDFKGVGYATAWASEDLGTTWHEVTTFARSDAGPFGSETYDGTVTGFRAATRFDGQLIAVGTTGNGAAPLWIGTWTR